MRITHWMLIGGLAFLGACSGDDTATEGKPNDTGAAADKTSFGKADAWNYRNNPDGLRVEMKKNLSDLGTATETVQTEKDAWPDTYWPTYRDSYNARWQKTGEFLTDLSPAEKYDAAFNGWDPESVKDLKPFDGNNCSLDDDGNPAFDLDYYNNLGPVADFTSKRKGNAATREAIVKDELNEWCNAKEDSQCVTACGEAPPPEAPNPEYSRCKKRCDRGGVETWWGLCHAWAPAAVIEKEPLYPVTYNGVTFEIGDIKALFSAIYDRSDAALIGGRCNEFEVERDETTGRINNDGCRDLNAGSFHVATVNLLKLQKRGFVEDRTFDYEVWNQPVQGYEITKFEEITVAQAHELLNVDAENPTDCISGVDVASGDYCYNGQASKLYEVHTSLDWVTESHASTVAEGAENLERYTRTDRYTYILEVDGDNNVLGGEWFGSSIENHPDFIWLPFRARGGNPHIDVEKVRLLGRLSQEPPAAEATADVIDGENTDTVNIPDNDPTGINSVIAIGADVVARELHVSIDITHTYIGDLVINLTSPTGKIHALHNRAGGPADNLVKTFHIYEPQGSIAGDWTLSVVDTYNIDTGSLNGWKMNFAVGPAPANELVKLYDGAAMDIPDNQADGVIGSIDVPQAGSIKRLRLALDIKHTYIADLEIALIKEGVTKIVHNREGGSADDIKTTVQLDEFNGQEASGKWTLQIKDLARRDQGNLVKWSLEIVY